jgi:hypothetical protein
MSTEEKVKREVSALDKMYNQGTNYTLNLLEIRMKSRGRMTYQEYLEWRAVSFPNYTPIIDIAKVEFPK